LLNDKQIEVTYRAITSGKEAKTYPVHPLGLVVMEQVVYLVCTVKDYQDPRFLAVHRIDSAQLLDSDASNHRLSISMNSSCVSLASASAVHR
jgi:predicted DNA-binding transcriptional regulator YafY